MKIRYLKVVLVAAAIAAVGVNGFLGHNSLNQTASIKAGQSNRTVESSSPVNAEVVPASPVRDDKTRQTADVPDSKHILKEAFETKTSTIPLPFVKNIGQVAPEVAFYAKTFAGTAFVTKDQEIVYSLPYKDQTSGKTSPVVVKERFSGMDKGEVQGEGLQKAKFSYIKGNDRSKWADNIPSFEQLTLGEIRNGITLKVKAHNNNIEKLFYVSPGADPSRIKGVIDGATALSVADDGRLSVQTEKGDFQFTKPIAYQLDGDNKKQVEVAYFVDSSRTTHDAQLSTLSYGFSVGEYDKSRELIIDPLVATTLLDFSQTDEIKALAVDKDGNVYAAGTTFSSDFPVTQEGSFVGDNPSFEVFMVKMNPDLSELLASTIIGGHDNSGLAMKLDNDGNVFIVGRTSAVGACAYSDLCVFNFPVTSGTYSAEPPSHGGLAGFIVKLDSELNVLASALPFNNNYFKDIIIDDTGNVIVSGYGGAKPTTGAYKREGSALGNIAKFDNTLTHLIALSTCYDDPAGSSYDERTDLAFSIDGNILFIHTDRSTGKSGGQPAVGEISSDLSTLIKVTYLYNSAAAIAVDAGGNVFVSGFTYYPESLDFPTTTGAYVKRVEGSSGIFVTKLDKDLNIVASSLNENTGHDVRAMAVDNGGNIILIGSPIHEGPAINGFIVMPNDLSTLLEASKFGVKMFDFETYPLALAVDNDNVYIGGYVFGLLYETAELPFSTTLNAYQTTPNNKEVDNDNYTGGFITIKTLNKYSSVTVAIEGSGTVKSTDSKIVCSDTSTTKCSYTYAVDASKVIELRPYVKSGYYFSGWTVTNTTSGETETCSDLTKCRLTLTGDKNLNVVATFKELGSYTVSVTVNNENSSKGKVTGSVYASKQISCSNYLKTNICTQSRSKFTSTKKVTLTAVSYGKGSKFTGWSGLCTGTTRKCTFTIVPGDEDSTYEVTANFTK